MPGAAPNRPVSENPSQPPATAPQRQPGAFASDSGEDEIGLLDLKSVHGHGGSVPEFNP
jgi:hypothetical protein